ncbi:ABC transporter substrate-binding protein [Mycolicibacterium goodii]|uniref:ABC transporter substrate-binding protein n=1 Tax=Mycolicibacterium goodii TaxID=134601 RepID=UPI001BDC9DD4|nr:ABC transporter substrate-binding protein [Mycolicibacterium goodii]MBU8811130.1 ABC transporter substrate-binding protein [Mycolicibacterium goodii]MBU8830056.1 ABC transporter substrate-binding protein [Mycolicibacterium goodii]ULN45820.1 ABC transporter substrate-binding protein [Mycolicibacterium goodii]
MRAITALLTLLPLAICAFSGCSARGAEPSPHEETTNYPLTLENCGVTVTIDRPPQRVVSLYQASTEILLSLGLADRMVGTSTWFDPVLPALAEENASVPRLADNDPSLETVLAAEPDLVTSASAHTFTPAVVAERARLGQLGVATYQSPSVCTGAEVDGETVTRTEPLTFDTLFDEINQLARMFDVPERGARLVDDLQRRLSEASLEPKPGTTVAYWFSGLRTPYMAGCCSAPGLYTAALGLANVFADASEDWPEVSWEAVAARDPDVLVLADLNRRRIDGDALDTKIGFLESNPVTRHMTAVRNKRYVVLTGSELDPGIRQVQAVEKMAAGLESFGLVS